VPIHSDGFSDSKLDGIVGRRRDEAADTTLGREREGGREGGREVQFTAIAFNTWTLTG